MNENEFWQLIEIAKDKSKGDSDEQTRIIYNSLTNLSEKELVDFENIFQQYMNQACTLTLFDAAWMILGWWSKDSFRDFRVWLIAQGHEFYEKALIEPDNLADFVEFGQDVLVETLNHLALTVYAEKTGDYNMPSRIVADNQLKGTMTEPEDFPTNYPRLYTKFIKDKGVVLF